MLTGRNVHCSGLALNHQDMERVTLLPLKSSIAAACFSRAATAMSFFISMDTSFSSLGKVGRCSTCEASLHRASKHCNLDGKFELADGSTGSPTGSCCPCQSYLKLPGGVQSAASLPNVRRTSAGSLWTDDHAWEPTCTAAASLRLRTQTCPGCRAGHDLIPTLMSAQQSGVERPGVPVELRPYPRGQAAQCAFGI